MPKAKKKTTTKLVIVESPAKARTIEKYLGSDYLVEASVGHILDLPKRSLGVDISNGFTPKYEVIQGKQSVIDALSRKLCIDNLSALPAYPDHSAVLKALHLDAYRIDAFVTHQHHVGPMDRSLFFYNTPMSRLTSGLGVTFDKIHIFNDKTIRVPKDPQDLAHLILFLARNNSDFVVLLDAALHS